MTELLTLRQYSRRPLTRKQAAEIAGLSERQIDRLIADGTLPAKKYAHAVRINAEAFWRWQERSSITPVHTRASVDGDSCLVGSSKSL